MYVIELYNDILVPVPTIQLARHIAGIESQDDFREAMRYGDVKLYSFSERPISNPPPDALKNKRVCITLSSTHDISFLKKHPSAYVVGYTKEFTLVRYSPRPQDFAVLI